MARLSGIPQDECPTCGSFLSKEGERVNGKYRYLGIEYDCDCDTQILLRKWYLYSGIPADQYGRLDIEDFQGNEDAKDFIIKYLENWPSFKRQGIGPWIYGKTLGSGKTMIATYVAKELVKRGEKVFFLPFNKMLNVYRYHDELMLDKLQNTNVLILDEVLAPPHDSFKTIFADQLEDLIRNRTNFNGTTIITTNLTPDELEEHYHRTFSLLEPKTIRVELNGDDARQSFVAEQNLALALANETKPLC
jgi:DNA replication protein DnaC